MVEDIGRYNSLILSIRRSYFFAVNVKTNNVEFSSKNHLLNGFMGFVFNFYNKFVLDNSLREFWNI